MKNKWEVVFYHSEFILPSLHHTFIYLRLLELTFIYLHFLPIPSLFRKYVTFFPKVKFFIVFYIWNKKNPIHIPTQTLYNSLHKKRFEYSITSISMFIDIPTTHQTRKLRLQMSFLWKTTGLWHWEKSRESQPAFSISETVTLKKRIGKRLWIIIKTSRN